MKRAGKIRSVHPQAKAIEYNMLPRFRVGSSQLETSDDVDTRGTHTIVSIVNHYRN